VLPLPSPRHIQRWRIGKLEPNLSSELMGIARRLFVVEELVFDLHQHHCVRLIPKMVIRINSMASRTTLSPMAMPEGDGLQEVVGDKGYHSNQSLMDLEAVGVRSYISEPDRGRRNWKKKAAARAAAYRNRRRIRGARGLRLLRLRGERLERPFAHLYETGGMRRVYLRGHTNIRKRLLIHAGGLNLGLLMRQLIGVGTPCGLQGRLIAAIATLIPLIQSVWLRWPHQQPIRRLFSQSDRASIARCDLAPIGAGNMAFTTGS
jgi:hypothetical protein